MKKTKPFAYPVSEYGLPRNWCTVNPVGNENLLGLTIQELATTFWLLEGIQIHYAYILNGIRTERNILLHSEIEPYLRIAEDPVFQYYYNDPDNYESHFALELWSIAHPPSFNGKVDLRFSATERDSNQLFTLTCDSLPNYRLLDEKPFSLLNRKLIIKLWTQSSEWAGNIEFFNLSTNYYYVNIISDAGKKTA